MTGGNIPVHALVFCCGWETNSNQTIFSYIFTYLPNNIICVKTLAHWFFKIWMKFLGLPPTLDDIKTEPEKLNMSVDSLFVNKTWIMHN